MEKIQWKYKSNHSKVNTLVITLTANSYERHVKNQQQEPIHMKHYRVLSAIQGQIPE